MKLQLLLLLVLSTLSINVLAQGPTDPPAANNAVNAVNESWQPSLRPDGVIDRVPHNHILTPWQNIREADVLWKKRVWREIDARQKQNFALRYPGGDFSGGGMYIEILLDAINKGKVTAFTDDRYTTPISYEDIKDKVAGKADTTYVEDEDGNLKMIITLPRFDPDIVTKFKIKEDWIFDRNLGRMVVRILGIAPYFDKKGEGGTYSLSLPMFWLYYPDVRPINVQYEVYNPENDVFRITWDDWFEKRMFASFVTKSSINNPYLSDIKNYKNGIQKLYESEKVKETIFNKEHDLWVY